MRYECFNHIQSFDDLHKLKVIDILNTYSENDNVVGVVSAVGGITNKLLEAGQLAKNCDNLYNEIYEFIYEKHMTIISELIPSDNSYVKEVYDIKFEKTINFDCNSEFFNKEIIIE